MAELLCKFNSNYHPNPEKDQRGCYKKGMIVCIFPDGHIYGSAEGMPTFFKIKIPLVPVDHPVLLRLTQSQFSGENIIRRRRCWLRHENIPANARDKILDTGEIIIKANSNYTGEYDYTWNQIKTYFWDEEAQANFNDELN